MQWKTPASPGMNKATMSKSQVKATVINFFDIRGTIMTE
jgi:hypothetical protein